MCDISKVIEDYFDDDNSKKMDVAERMGMAYSTFKRKTNPHDDRQLLVTEVIPYTLNTDFSLLDHIEARLGRVAVSIKTQDKDVNLKSLSDFAEASGAAMSEMAKSLADGEIDSEERRRVTAAMIELSMQVSTIIATLNKEG